MSALSPALPYMKYHSKFNRKIMNINKNGCQKVVPCIWFCSSLQELCEFTRVCVCVSLAFMHISADLCVHLFVHALTDAV